jgi:hypothetical protein
MDEAPPGTSALEYEIARFTRRVERGERLNFNLPALALLEETRRRNLGLHDVVNDLRAAWVIPLAKVQKDNERAWTDDEMNSWILQQVVGDSIPPGTAVLPPVASNAFGVINRGYLKQTPLSTYGNPFDETNAAKARGTITRVLMNLCDGAHYAVLAFNFDRQTRTGLIQYWNSLHTPGKGFHSRTTKAAPVYAEYLSGLPQINLPGFDWSTPIQVEEQTQQRKSTIDCGPLSINALIHAVHDTPPEVVHGERDVGNLVMTLRHRYLSMGFEQYMGVDSMDDYVEEHLMERAEPMRQRREERLKEAAARRQRRDAKAEARRQRKEAKAEARRQRREAKRMRLEQEKADAERKRLEEERAEAERQRQQEGANDNGDDNGAGDGMGDGQQNPPDNLNVRIAALEGLMRTLIELTNTNITLTNDNNRTTQEGMTRMARELTTMGTQIQALSRGQRQSRPAVSDRAYLARREEPSTSGVRRSIVHDVDSSHPAHGISLVLVTGSQVGNPSADGGFFTQGGEQIATYDDQGNVRLLDGTWVGNYTD